MQIEEVRIDEISNHPTNPKIHPENQIRLLQKSIKKFGYTNPVILSADGTILAGHARVKAAIAMGQDTIPAIRTKLTGKEADAYLVADNRLTEIAQYNRDVLAELLSDLPKDLVDLTGFDSVQVDALLAGEDIPDIDRFISDSQPEEPREEVDAEPQIDRAAELNKTWKVKPGDMWQCGDHRLICGDCTDPAVVEKLMQGEKAEICFTSPPYSDMREYKSDEASNLEKLIRFIPAIKPYSNYCLINLGLKIKDREIVQYWNEYITEAKKAGYLFLSWCVWDKMVSGGVSNQSAMFSIEHEWIFVFGNEFKKLNRTVENSPDTAKRRKSDRKDSSGRSIRGVRGADGNIRYSPRGKDFDFKNLPSVVQVSPYLARNDETIGAHPAVMSVELPEVYINAMTDPEQYVLEPFTGSGTTMIACENTGRKCRGIEISPDYVSVCLQRFLDATGKMPVLLGGI